MANDTHYQEWLKAVRKSRQILLVEDNRSECQLIVDLSRDYCLDWAIAHNYYEALEQFAIHGFFRLVILDLDLKSQPQGIDLYRWIKKHHPEVAVMVFSGYISDRVIQDIHKEGFAFFTPKPNVYDPEFFRQMFRALAIPLPMPNGTNRSAKDTDLVEI